VRAGAVLCPSWGYEVTDLAEWTHRVAHDLARVGVPTVVPQWPGTQDSHGEADDATLESFRDAAVDATLASARHVEVAEWFPIGLRVGASVAALAATALQSRWLLLVEPTLDLDAHFRSVERSARRASLGKGLPGEWVHGYPHPPGLRQTTDADRVALAVQSFQGEAAVIRYRRPTQPALAGVRTISIWGDWRTPLRPDHAPLRTAAVRWVNRTLRRSA
jgi:hypothetical protein